MADTTNIQWCDSGGQVKRWPCATELADYHIDMPALYAAFAAQCRANGHSPAGIGRRLGVGADTLTQMKRGTKNKSKNTPYRNCSAIILLRICAWAGLEPLQFLRRPGGPT